MYRLLLRAVACPERHKIPENVYIGRPLCTKPVLRLAFPHPPDITKEARMFVWIAYTMLLLITVALPIMVLAVPSTRKALLHDISKRQILLMIMTAVFAYGVVLSIIPAAHAIKGDGSIWMPIGFLSISGVAGIAMLIISRFRSNDTHHIS